MVETAGQANPSHREIPKTSDVVIVGGGIGGSVLALDLINRGWSVTVLEREVSPPTISRPEILFGATVDKLDNLDVGHLVRDASVLLTGIQLQEGDNPLLRFDQKDFEAANVRGYSTNPALTRTLIMKIAQDTGVNVLRGTKVTDVIQKSDQKVQVKGIQDEKLVEMNARLVVGDDGVRSVVRDSLHIPISLESFPFDFLGLSTPRLDGLPKTEGRGWINPAAFTFGLPVGIFVPVAEDKYNVVFGMSKGYWSEQLKNSPNTFWKNLEELTPLASLLREKLLFPNDFTPILDRQWGHAEYYVDNGVAIIGDAAHPVSPAGGQGANAAIWDGLVLAEVADKALRKSSISKEDLKEYELWRRPANERSVNFTQQATIAIHALKGLPKPDLWFFPILRLLDRNTEIKRKILHNISTAFVSDLDTF